MITNFKNFINENNMVAQTIVNQLGGNKFASMTGATFYNADKGLNLKFKGSKKANTMVIELNAMDTYDIKFYKIRGVEFKLVEEFEGIYADQLQETFKKVTGLYTSL